MLKLLLERFCKPLALYTDACIRAVTACRQVGVLIRHYIVFQGCFEHITPDWNGLQQDRLTVLWYIHCEPCIGKIGF